MKDRKYQSESRLQDPNPEDRACRSQKPEWMTVLKTVRVFDGKKMCTLDTQTGSVPRTIMEEPELKAWEPTKMTTFRSLMMYNYNDLNIR